MITISDPNNMGNTGIAGADPFSITGQGGGGGGSVGLFMLVLVILAGLKHPTTSQRKRRSVI